MHYNHQLFNLPLENELSLSIKAENRPNYKLNTFFCQFFFFLSSKHTGQTRKQSLVGRNEIHSTSLCLEHTGQEIWTVQKKKRKRLKPFRFLNFCEVDQWNWLIKMSYDWKLKILISWFVDSKHKDSKRFSINISNWKTLRHQPPHPCVDVLTSETYTCSTWNKIIHLCSLFWSLELYIRRLHVVVVCCPSECLRSLISFVLLVYGKQINVIYN